MRQALYQCATQPFTHYKQFIASFVSYLVLICTSLSKSVHHFTHSKFSLISKKKTMTSHRTSTTVEINFKGEPIEELFDANAEYIATYACCNVFIRPNYVNQELTGKKCYFASLFFTGVSCTCTCRCRVWRTALGAPSSGRFLKDGSTSGSSSAAAPRETHYRVGKDMIIRKRWKYSGFNNLFGSVTMDPLAGGNSRCYITRPSFEMRFSVRR